MRFRKYGVTLFLLLLMTSCAHETQRGLTAEGSDPSSPASEICESPLAQLSLGSIVVGERPFDLSRFRSTLAGFDPAQRFQQLQATGAAQAWAGSPMAFEDALAIVTSAMPTGQRYRVTDAIAKLNELEVTVANEDVSPKKNTLQLPNRFLHPFAFSRARKARVRWSIQPIKDEADFYNRLMQASEILAYANYNAVRKLSVYRARPNTFMGDNLETIVDKMVADFYTIEGVPGRVPNPSALGRMQSVVRSVLVGMLPFQFAALGGAKLNATHAAILREQGPQALYRYLVKTQGLGVATRYWGTHVANLSTVIGLGILAVMAPGIIEGYFYFSKHQEIKFDSEEERKKAEGVIENSQKKPEEILEDLKKNLKDIESDPKKRKRYEELLKELAPETEKKSPPRD